MSTIVKADGTVEAFDGDKLEFSLRRAGAGEHTAQRIRRTIESSIGGQVGTHEVYKRAFTMLRGETRTAAARYSLRRAMFELGPTGHPFEDFVAHMFEREGWNIEARKMVPGKCVSHEVDVYATRNGEYLAAELKYHNDPTYKTDVKTALYVQARFEDIWQCDPTQGACPIDHGFLITNTKFTSQAIQYAKCAGLNLLGWSYPHEGNLYDRIVASGIYPITASTLLRKAEKKLLINMNIATCDQLLTRREALRTIGVSAERMGAILTEVQKLSEPFAVSE